MKNQQRPMPRFVSDGSSLFIHSIFWTIQGEGPFAGKPALFIRLAGCNLQCPLCDTEYSTDEPAMTIPEILSRIHTERDLMPGDLVVITGGEPFRQNLTKLVAALGHLHCTVQIETNGKLEPQDPDTIAGQIARGILHVVCSPKTHSVHEWFPRYSTAYKFVVKHNDTAGDGLPIHALDHPVPHGKTIARPPESFHGDIFVQPADEKDEELNRRNMIAAVRAVMRDPARRRLCLQMHKYADLP